jgi:hypothetical protein
MSLCSRCGVDIGDATSCPLCGLASGYDASVQTPSHARNLVELTASVQPPSRARHLFAAELLTVSLGIAALTVFLVDLLTGGGISWSLYPLAALGFIWLGFCPLIMATKRKALGLAFTALAPFAFLLALDAINGDMNWSLRLGLPMAAAVELAVAFAAFASMRSKRKGLNLLSYSLLAIAFVCLAVEGVISLWLGGSLRFAWSFIASSALVPIALFLLYAHHRVATDATLRRLFHV